MISQAFQRRHRRALPPLKSQQYALRPLVNLHAQNAPTVGSFVNKRSLTSSSSENEHRDNNPVALDQPANQQQQQQSGRARRKQAVQL
jgi:hypothetical protein